MKEFIEGEEVVILNMVGECKNTGVYLGKSGDRLRIESNGEIFEPKMDNVKVIPYTKLHKILDGIVLGIFLTFLK